MYHSEEGIFWFQQNCCILDMPSRHLATTSHCIRRMLLGTFNSIPMPGCCGWGSSWGAQGDGHCPTAGFSISSEGWLPVYIRILLPIIFLLGIVFLFLCVSGFLFEDSKFSALVDGILKKYAYGIFCKTFYVYLK